eukprot:jgi/Tetstr1/432984/TSEL_022321.t1
MDDLVLKLRQSGAAAKVVAPAWHDRPWMPPGQLHDLATTEVLHCPPSPGLIFPGRRAGRARRHRAAALERALPIAPVMPWAASMRTGVLRPLGADHIGQRGADFLQVTDLLSATLKPRSVASYSSMLNLFMDFFCVLGGFSTLDAGTPFVVRYISWAADRGRNKAGAF